MNHSIYQFTKIVLHTVIIGTVLLLPGISQAVNFEPSVGDQTGTITKVLSQDLSLGTESPVTVVFDLINTALTLLGTVCVILIIYAGFIWVWARGNQEEVQRAKEILQGTIIGLLIVLASLGIARFVFTTVGDIAGAEVETTDAAE